MMLEVEGDVQLVPDLPLDAVKQFSSDNIVGEIIDILSFLNTLSWFRMSSGSVNLARLFTFPVCILHKYNFVVSGDNPASNSNTLTHQIKLEKQELNE